MQDTPMRDNTAEQDYENGFELVMWYAERARQRGWHLTERRLVHEIVQRERAASMQHKSSLPIVNAEQHSAAWNLGQADALRALLRTQRVEKES